ncbi:hypothetical protein L1049_028370 [Liquidambar formosana]|uniref:Uncharacterized protein n=1 Tax=Liquidambar formosana TaxID=63359 RepID=A0AAP0RKE5_LIQFO
MDDGEKLTALKKAYADIILNTAKEAAARIMVSERKAIRFQHELSSSKEEALHMLLRLKQMMDTKVSEAEMTSLSQQRKIEELEAQLQEAEDIVKDLREELREVQAELEKATTNQLQPLAEQNLKRFTATQEEISQEDRLNTSGFVIFPPPVSQPEPLTTSDMNNSILNERNEGNKCYSTNESPLENCYGGNPDFSSIIMRSKEPELYRNGCTQRIRAFERNMLDEKLSLSGQVDNVKNESILREDEEGEGMCIALTPKADNSCSLEKNPDEFKEVMQVDSSCYQVQAVKYRRKRNGFPRRKRSKAPSFRPLPNQVLEISQASDLSFSKTFPVNNNVRSSDNPSKITDIEAQKDPESLQPQDYPQLQLR